MKRRVIFYFILFSLLTAAKSASAQITYVWQGGTSGTWNTPGNWTIAGFTSTIFYPGSFFTNDIAVIPTSSSAVTTLTYTGTHTIGQLQTSGFKTNSIAINFSGAAPTLTISSGLSIIQQNGAMVGIAFTGTGTAVIGGTSTFGYQQSMSIASASTVTFSSGSTIDFTSNQGTLTNNGTLNLTSSTFKLGFNATLASTGTVVGNNSLFNMTNSSAYITYTGIFVSNSCTFDVPSSAYMISTSTSTTFTATTSTFNLSGSGGAAYLYNNGTYRDHGSTYNLTGQAAYIQNAGTGTVHMSGTTVNFSNSAGSNNQSIRNGGNFTADSASVINLQSFNSYISNSNNFHAGTSGSACTINITGQGGIITNATTGTFYLGSTSIIYPNSFQATIKNTSPGVFTLQSDANGTAAIGPLTSTAVCTGTFNAERYFQGSASFDNVKNRWVARNYRIISPPVADTLATSYWGLNYIVGTTTGKTTTANSASNAFITGCTGGSTSAGNPSIYLYRESYTPSNSTFISGNFLGITNITNSTNTGSITASDGSTYSLPVGNGVFFFFRGAATNWSTRTASPYIAPENVTLTSVGTINTQSVTVKDWYNSGSSTLGYTGAGMGTNYTVRGFNMVGNPYPCTIDWCTAFSNTGITRTNINPTIYEYDPVTNQYDTFICNSSSTGTATGNGSRYITSGQGFFVQANTTGASLVFTESAKAPTQLLTGGNLLMGTPTPQVAGNQLFRLKLSVDSLNYDDIVLSFNSSASSKYDFNEDAAYIPGLHAPEGLSSFSDDGVKLSINSLPLPAQKPRVIGLSIEAAYSGVYTFRKTALDAIPKIFEIWLMDRLKKDSLDLRNNSTYAFDVNLGDTTTYGDNRFKLIIRQNPALGIHLLNFTATKATAGSQIVWKTENEENYTNFTVERSNNGGANYTVLGGIPSNAQGTYSLADKNPLDGANQYRLKIEDLNGAITYSNVVTLMYGNTAAIANNINVYPNPSNGVINIAINQPIGANNIPGLPALQSIITTPSLNELAPGNSGSTSYGIKIINITGSVVKSVTTKSANWQENLGYMAPGTYVVQVVNTSDNSVVGKSTFVKL